MPFEIEKDLEILGLLLYYLFSMQYIYAQIDQTKWKLNPGSHAFLSLVQIPKGVLISSKIDGGYPWFDIN